jgi:signal peptidase I
MQAHTTNPTYVAYTGSSMEPVFIAGDILQVLPYEQKQVRRGDVILYSCASQSCNVVHRVDGFDARGIRTKGDNNRRADPWVVQHHQVVGYVARALHNRCWRRIQGGCIGLLKVKSTNALKYVDQWINHSFINIRA